MIRLAVCGATGRMGKRILSIASADIENFDIVGAVEHASHPLKGTKISDFIDGYKGEQTLFSELDKCIQYADVVIDFSTADATVEHASICLQNQKPMVIGTTGLDHKQRRMIIEYAKKIPIVMAPNMSVGVNLLFSLVKQVATMLNEDYDIEIIETHHRFKKDAPSGTAVRLADIAAQARNVSMQTDGVYGRRGIVGERKKGAIGVHSVRSGNVVGEHVVSFANLGERIELTHKAQSRDTFAQGALRAGQFIIAKHYGLYDMQDVLGLK